ncbi:RHS repeat domain-containing protein, partial [Paenibacillus nicotianae]
MNKSIRQTILFMLSILLICNLTLTPAYSASSTTLVSNKSLLSVKSPSKIAPVTDLEPEEWTSVMESVYQDVYEPDNPELDKIQAKLNHLEESQSKRLFTFSLSDQSVKSEESTLSTEQVNTLVEDGAEVIDVYWLEYLTRINGNNPLTMWRYQQDNQKSWEEVQDHYARTSSNSPSVTEEVYQSSVTTMNRNLSANMVSIAATSDEDSDLDDKIKGAFDNLVKQQILQGNTKSQFAERTESTEEVSQSSGSLTWKESQISLPGRDGLNLNIGVAYNSGQSSAYTGYSTPKGTASIMKGNYFASRYDLGLGWEFQFPSLEGAVPAIASLTYHDGQGGIKAVDFMDSYGIVGKTHIQDSQNTTQIFMIDNKKLFSNGTDFSNFYMEYSDQKREYFSGDGRLLGIVDRFGNQIVYHYQNRTDFLGESKLMISSITDSVGRTVEFQYDSTMGQGQEFQGEDIRLIVKDSSGKEIQRVTYTKGRVATNNRGVADGYAPVLSKITNTLGEIKVLDYDFLEGSFRYKTSKSNAPKSYALLKKVTYPRSITQYQYESSLHKLGKKGESIDYRILSREDWSLASNDTPLSSFNHIDYTYVGDYTGYPEAYDRLTYKPENYRYQQTATVRSNSASNEMRTTYTFDGNQKLITTEMKNSKGEVQKSINLSFHPDFKYSPTQTQTIEQDAEGSTTRTNETIYTDWGGISSQTDALIDSDFNNATIKAQHTINYTYQDQFKLLTSKSWYQDNNKQVNEKYTYNSDGRPLSVTNSLGENTIYNYQASPQNEHQIKQITVSKLVRSGVTSTTTTAYGEATNYAYPTEQTQSITNTAKDGSKNTQVIRQQTKYDMGTGLPTQQIDSNGKATTTTYDALGRPVKIVSPSITNLDGTIYAVEDQYGYTNRAYSTEADSTNAGILTMRVDAIRQYTNTATGAVTVLSRQSSYYDGFGFLRVDETYNESNGWTRSQYHPDDQGRAIYAIDPLGNTQTASYDAWGQQIEATDPYGNLYITANHMTQRKNNHFAIAAADVSAYRANADNRSIRLNAVEQSYDVYGNLATTTAFKDGASQSQPIKENYTYDLQGNILSYTDPNQTKNSNGVTSNYTYDALNRLTAVQDGIDQTTRYAYDGTGGLTKITVNDSAGKSETLYTKAYNEAGQLTDKTDTSGKNTANSYSSRGL